MTAYEPRRVRFLELWQPAGWRLKLYSILYRKEQPDAELISWFSEIMLLSFRNKLGGPKSMLKFLETRGWFPENTFKFPRNKTS